MKKGYLEFDFLLLIAYISLSFQFVMARHSHHHRMSKNQDCYRCPPGYGVERHCNRLHDTECGACAPDHYSSHFSASRPCYPCSRCGTGLYVAHKCTASNDTVCDSCHTYRGPRNADFYERCVMPLMDLDNITYGVHSQTGASAKNPSVSVHESRGLTSVAFVASGLAAGAVGVVLMISCIVITHRKSCRRIDHNYPYVAVSTKEAVML